ncbi:hypothetical protein KCP76_23835 [Salmonella enterica subsp. enterica serovar Weltevreden]|nr:hypothetical protein KCP76_23835 [Salmonella enterica subsp. enterica serovar Weltevreden]
MSWLPPPSLLQQRCSPIRGRWQPVMLRQRFGVGNGDPPDRDNQRYNADYLAIPGGRRCSRPASKHQRHAPSLRMNCRRLPDNT